MLSESERAALKQPIMVLRLIIFALAMGVIMFGVVVAMITREKPKSLGTNINYPVLAIALSIMAAGLIVPRLLPNRSEVPASVRQPVADPKVRDALDTFAAKQVKTIIGAALFEGAAFMNLVWYMLSAELVHAAAAAICLLAMLAHFPLTGRVEEQIEDQRRRRREEGQLSG